MYFLYLYHFHYSLSKSTTAAWAINCFSFKLIEVWKKTTIFPSLSVSQYIESLVKPIEKSGKLVLADSLFGEISLSSDPRSCHKCGNTQCVAWTWQDWHSLWYCSWYISRRPWLCWMFPRLNRDTLYTGQLIHSNHLAGSLDTYFIDQQGLYSRNERNRRDNYRESGFVLLESSHSSFIVNK